MKYNSLNPDMLRNTESYWMFGSRLNCSSRRIQSKWKLDVCWAI